MYIGPDKKLLAENDVGDVCLCGCRCREEVEMCYAGRALLESLSLSLKPFLTPCEGSTVSLHRGGTVHSFAFGGLVSVGSYKAIAAMG